MNLRHIAVSAAVLASLMGGAWPVVASPGAALQEARTQSRIRQGQGEDIVVSRNHLEVAKQALIQTNSHVGTQHLSSEGNFNLFANLTTDSEIFEPSEDPYPGQRLREARQFSRIRRGVGEDIHRR